MKIKTTELTSTSMCVYGGYSNYIIIYRSRSLLSQRQRHQPRAFWLEILCKLKWKKIALNVSCTNAQRHQIFSGALFKHLVIASLIKFEIYSLRMAMLCRGTLTAKEKNKSVDALWSS